MNIYYNSVSNIIDQIITWDVVEVNSIIFNYITTI